jgi:hypothetical protein
MSEIATDVPDIVVAPYPALDSSILTGALRTALHRLNVLRSTRDAQAATLAELREAFDAAHREHIDALTTTKRELESIEAEIRGSALVVHDITGEPKPVAGVEIKGFTVYAIDETAALAWAREKQLCLVPESLDVKALQALAKVQALPFVTVSKEYKAQIATDLTRALAAAEVAS